MKTFIHISLLNTDYTNSKPLQFSSGEFLNISVQDLFKFWNKSANFNTQTWHKNLEHQESVASYPFENVQ